uniref:Uncharacterized protein n=1 Tax=Anopheles quadriannulatus TaxID=34691 RepID=A0A182XQU0_ANOQN
MTLSTVTSPCVFFPPVLALCPVEVPSIALFRSKSDRSEGGCSPEGLNSARCRVL